MTSKDIVERLRGQQQYTLYLIERMPPEKQEEYKNADIYGQAADEIERLRKELRIADEAISWWRNRPTS